MGLEKKEWWTFTVAKKGPEKNPNKLTATASVMIFGTLANQILVKIAQNMGVGL